MHFSVSKICLHPARHTTCKGKQQVLFISCIIYKVEMHLSEVKSLVQTHHPHKWLMQTRFQGFQHLAACSSQQKHRASDNISLFTGPLWGTMKSPFLWSIRVWIDDTVHCGHRHCLPPLPAGMQAAKAVLNLQCQAYPTPSESRVPLVPSTSEPLFWNEGADLSVSYFKGTGHGNTSVTEEWWRGDKIFSSVLLLEFLPHTMREK